MGLAERVAAERCESLGEPGAVTGYQVCLCVCVTICDKCT